MDFTLITIIIASIIILMINLTVWAIRKGWPRKRKESYSLLMAYIFAFLSGLTGSILMFNSLAERVHHIPFNNFIM